MIKTTEYVRILIPKELVLRLMDKYQVSRVSVYSALNYTTNSDKAKAIRADALEAGGKQIKATKIVEDD